MARAAQCGRTACRRTVAVCLTDISETAALQIEVVSITDRGVPAVAASQTVELQRQPGRKGGAPLGATFFINPM
eukprot:5758157-Prymnesium_polylepis.1